MARAGDAEENYYSPRSQASFSDSFSSAADTAERSASEGAEQPLPSPFAAPAAAALPPVRACNPPVAIWSADCLLPQLMVYGLSSSSSGSKHPDFPSPSQVPPACPWCSYLRAAAHTLPLDQAGNGCQAGAGEGRAVDPGARARAGGARARARGARRQALAAAGGAACGDAAVARGGAGGGRGHAAGAAGAIACLSCCLRCA